MRYLLRNTESRMLPERTKGAWDVPICIQGKRLKCRVRHACLEPLWVPQRTPSWTNFNHSIVLFLGGHAYLEGTAVSHTHSIYFPWYRGQRWNGVIYDCLKSISRRFVRASTSKGHLSDGYEKDIQARSFAKGRPGNISGVHGHICYKECAY